MDQSALNRCNMTNHHRQISPETSAGSQYEKAMKFDAEQFLVDKFKKQNKFSLLC